MIYVDQGERLSLRLGESLLRDINCVMHLLISLKNNVAESILFTYLVQLINY